MKRSNGDIRPVWNMVGSVSEVDEDSHLLCSSQYFDPATGICKDGPTSPNKGKSCTLDADCGGGAECKCGWNENGNKFCDVLPGDNEWTKSRDKFIKYYEATNDNCNTAARWEECSQPKLFYSWKCAELKAKYYPYTIEDKSSNLTCMDTLRSDLPIFKEIDDICAKALSSYLKFGVALAGMMFGLIAI